MPCSLGGLEVHKKETTAVLQGHKVGNKSNCLNTGRFGKLKDTDTAHMCTSRMPSCTLAVVQNGYIIVDIP